MASTRPQLYTHTPVLLREVLHYITPNSTTASSNNAFSRTTAFASTVSKGFGRRTRHMMVPPSLGPLIKDSSEYTFVDATFGGGGYTKAILENFPRAKVIAIDQDPAAIMCAKQMAVDYANRVLPVRGKFGNLAELLKKNFGMSGQCIDGIVFDIGVSSYQIDQGYRGFSIRNDGPLDMRMCADKLYGEKFDELANSTVTAEYVVNNFLEKDLATMIFEYGDERKSRRIARAIVQARERNPIKTTSQLAAIIGKGAGKYLDSIHPATRTFQALRIYVNDELAELSRGLAQATDLLKPFGSLVAVTFHSHEDRIVKRFLRKESGKVEGLGLRYHKASGPGGYRGIDAYRRTRGLTQEAKSIAEMEIAYENDTEALTFRKVGNIELMEQEKSKMANNETNQLVRMVIRTKKAISASSDEIADNSRARSAKLRVGMRKS